MVTGCWWPGDEDFEGAMRMEDEENKNSRITQKIQRAPTKKSKPKKRIAVYAGSFDPPTVGHDWMIKQGAELFDQLVVAIFTNPDKKGMFSLEERVGMLKSITREYRNIKIDCRENEFLAKYAEEKGIEYYLRGTRNGKDFEYERELDSYNTKLNPQLKTILLLSPENFSNISSSAIRGMIGLKEWEKMIKPFLPKEVYNRVCLKKTLENLWMTENIKENLGVFYQEIIERYSGKERAYHNLDHLVECLNGVKSPEMVVSIIGHDIIYNPKEKDNEEKSARWTYDFCKKIGMDEAFSKKSEHLVLMTRHDKIPETNEEKEIIDRDLSIFSKPYDEFKKYDQDIRKEYSFVPDEIFYPARKKILKGFLERERVYYTNLFDEKTARENLKRAIKEM